MPPYMQPTKQKSDSSNMFEMLYHVHYKVQTFAITVKFMAEKVSEINFLLKILSVVLHKCFKL